MKTFCVILAGGTGTRLWPLSQIAKPKQFLDLAGVGRTMLQLTYDRFRSLCPPEDFVVVTLAEFRSLVREQLPEVPESNILCEPFKRNTAAAIVFASSFIKQVDPEATMVVTPADHLILNSEIFVKSVSEAVNYAECHDDIVTIGIKASRPETTYGYIQVGEPVESRKQCSIHHVRTFTEKPNAEMAQVFFDCGDFCWNSGVFVWRRSVIDAAMRKFMSSVATSFDSLDAIPVSHWTPAAIRTVYEQCETISVDYAVLEKARNVVVCQTSALWSDIGGWSALYEHNGKDDRGNAVVSGNAILKDSSGCLVHVDGKNVCVVEGLHDYMVIQRGDVTLVCPRNRGGSIWSYASEIRAEKD